MHTLNNKKQIKRKVINMMKNNRIFADNIRVSNDTRKTGLNNNDAIIGSSGSGKTGGYEAHNICNTDENIIVVDTKGTLYSKVENILRDKGYEVNLLDAVNPKRSNIGFNPFDYIEIRPDGSFNENDVASIATAMLPMNNEKDAFWISSARTLMESAIGYVIEALDEEDRNLSSLFMVINGILSKGDKEGIPFLESVTEDSVLGDGSFAYRKYLAFKNVIKAETTWGCITMFLTAFVNSLDTSDNKAIFCRDNNIRFEDFDNKKMALFINVSDTDKSFDKITSLIFSQAFKTLCNTADSHSDGALKRPVRLYLDDFATTTVIEDFDKLISVIRSRNIAVSIILQSIMQLETIYSKAASSTIITNCDHLLYLGGADYETANYLSLRSGIVPEKIMNLSADKALFLERGKKGEITDKLRPYSCIAEENNKKKQSVKQVEKGCDE